MERQCATLHGGRKCDGARVLINRDLGGSRAFEAAGGGAVGSEVLRVCCRCRREDIFEEQVPS